MALTSGAQKILNRLSYRIALIIFIMTGEMAESDDGLTVSTKPIILVWGGRLSQGG